MTEWFTRLKMWWHERRLDDADEYLSEFSVEIRDDDILSNERVIDMSRHILPLDTLRNTSTGETMTGREYLARITPPFPSLDKPAPGFVTLLSRLSGRGEKRILSDIDLPKGAYCQYQGCVWKVVHREFPSDWFQKGVYLTLRNHDWREPLVCS